MLKVVVKTSSLTRKKLADNNLGMSYHERLAKSKVIDSDDMFFQADCGNGYSRFQLNITDNKA